MTREEVLDKIRQVIRDCVPEMVGEELIAFNGNAHDFDARHYTHVVYPKRKPLIVRHLYDIFEFNGEVLEQDFKRLTAGRKSQPLSSTNTIIGDPSRIFIEEGAYVEGAVLNTNDGPIYIGQNVEVMEGACIRGGFAACHDAKVRIGAKVYGATTLGPHCKIGGEVENSVFIGYSNKAHDGFLGDAVIGEWCNIGGGTTASNLKNDYGEIKLWNYATKRFERTGLQFCGLFMGDHSKIGVNGMINTATVLGVGVNIHGAGFPRNFVASFQEGCASVGFKNVPLETFYTIAQRGSLLQTTCSDHVISLNKQYLFPCSIVRHETYSVKRSMTVRTRSSTAVL